MTVNMINTHVNSSTTCLGNISLASTVLDLNHIAKRFKIKGGHKLIMHWYLQWDDTVDSLNPKPKGCRARTMAKQEVKHHILDFVELMKSKRIPVNYKMIHVHVESSLGRKVPLRDIKRYGKEECGIRCKRTHELTLHDEEVAIFRKSVQRIGNRRLLFLDKTAIHSVMPPHQTHVAPDQQSLIKVDTPSAYAQRYDFIGYINGSQSIACMTLTPTT